MSEGKRLDLFLDKVIGQLKGGENFRYILDNILSELRADDRLSEADIEKAIAYFIEDKLDGACCKEITDRYLATFEIDPPDGWDYREP